MKKKMFIFGLGLLLAAGAVVTFVDKPLTAEQELLMRNVEALAGFEFNNQYWDDEGHWYNIFDPDWTPKLHECTGEKSLGLDSTYSKVTFEGRMVTCVRGSGNCFDGTDCLPI